MTQEKHPKTSVQQMKRLKIEAQSFGYPERRLATLDRLVAACDALENGKARPIIEKHTGKPFRQLKITASNVEKFVRAKGASDSDWSGPVRSTIAGDEDLISYVRTREEERVIKTGKTPVSTRFPTEVENLLGEIPSIEHRQAIRRKIEEGRIAIQKYKLLKSGLKNIPGIDADALLRNPSNGSKSLPQISTTENTIDFETRRLISKLHSRLTDENELSRIGMKYASGSLTSSANGTILATKSELEALYKLIASA
ncbi:MAG: hypothetical protein JJ879_13085 [Sneathiella sp.]|nr:hypothetical protein [Sneathiella sp.]